MDITVKRLPLGIVSNHLIDMVNEGDILEVMEPMGSFVYQSIDHSEKDIYLWGAGSGITPLLSILKVALQTNGKKITLLYCNKTAAQTIFYQQLRQLEEQYGERFSLILFLTNEDMINARQGRIEKSNVLDAVANVNTHQTIHYICGPLGLKQTVKDTLATIGLRNDQVLTEDFDHIVDHAKLEGVQNQVIELERSGKTYAFEVTRGKSILEAGLDAELDLPYSCQTGTCTLCKATLLDGEVRKIGDEEPDYILYDDERLLCCSYPLTANIRFTIK